MIANQINLNRFLSQADTQFIIPVYQRNYDWTDITGHVWELAEIVRLME
jgi:hypothetical protein